MSMHTPDPTAMSGTLETTNTGGGSHEHLTGVTRVFHHAAETARHMVDEILHRGGQVTQPVSQVAEDTAPEATLLGSEPVTEPEAPAAPEEPQEAPQEDAQEPEATEPSTESEDAAETPAEDAPAAPKTRKRAAAKPAPDAPAEAAQ